MTTVVLCAARGKKTPLYIPQSTLLHVERKVTTKDVGECTPCPEKLKRLGTLLELID